MHTLIHSVNKYLLSIYSVLEVCQAVNEMDALHPHDAYNLIGETNIKQLHNSLNYKYYKI